jgi:hypothetical protein
MIGSGGARGSKEFREIQNLGARAENAMKELRGTIYTLKEQTLPHHLSPEAERRNYESAGNGQARFNNHCFSVYR